MLLRYNIWLTHPESDCFRGAVVARKDAKSMSKLYLAVDIGASSGRHMLAWLENGKICLEEVWRFENKVAPHNGHLCWDVEYLFDEILKGLKKCKEIGRVPDYMGIDTWGVDFALLDADGNRIGDTVAYRDGRTENMDVELSKDISESELYARTGIQKQMYNTIYQLKALLLTQPELLKKADRLLMLPDYFHYLLTGVKINEYTNATTGQLVNADTGDWDYELMERVGIPVRLFGELKMPGTIVGSFSSDIIEKVGFNCTVILPATHDTGSAVAAVPAIDDDFLYISSGTWSLIGAERREPDCSEKSRLCNFTNEGGVEHRYRYLTNIMGLWMIQSIRREYDKKYSFGDLAMMAEEAKIISDIDVNDARFLMPDSMIEAVKSLCAETNQQVPETPGEVARVIYLGLAKCYGKAVREVEQITGRTYSRLHIVGGGCQDGFLNRLTAESTGMDVYAGPVEATALGNLAVQMMATGVFATLEEARDTIARSFEVKMVM